MSTAQSSKSGVAGGAKKVWDKGWALTSRYIGEPSNKLVGKWGIESFWPTTMDKELDKAARILRVFTLDGGVHMAAENVSDPSAHKKHQKIIKKIPQNVLAQAKGVAIFTVFRTGLHWSAASGSGVVLSRLQDGTWSAPSGILIHTLGIGFMVGIDIYDVVLVLNTEAAVQQFAHPRVKLGGEFSVAAGPVGEGRQLDVSRAASWSYTKSKGFYAGVQLDGTVIIERNDENARFYGQKFKTAQMLSGEVRQPPQAEGLYQVLSAAEGRQGRTDQIPTGMGPSEENSSVTQDALQGDGKFQNSAETPQQYGQIPVYDQGAPYSAGHPSQQGETTQYAQNPQHDQSPQYGQVPPYGQNSQHDQSQQYGQTRQYDGGAQYNQSSQYGQTSQYNQAPQQGQTPQYGQGPQYGQATQSGEAPYQDTGSQYGQVPSHGQAAPYGQTTQPEHTAPYGQAPYRDA